MNKRWQREEAEHKDYSKGGGRERGKGSRDDRLQEKGTNSEKRARGDVGRVGRERMMLWDVLSCSCIVLGGIYSEIKQQCE